MKIQVIKKAAAKKIIGSDPCPFLLEDSARGAEVGRRRPATLALAGSRQTARDGTCERCP